jgi:hypothetical protein
LARWKSRKNDDDDDDDDECVDAGGGGSARRERVRGWTDATRKVWRSAKAKRLFDTAESGRDGRRRHGGG